MRPAPQDLRGALTLARDQVEPPQVGGRRDERDRLRRHRGPLRGLEAGVRRAPRFGHLLGGAGSRLVGRPLGGLGAEGSVSQPAADLAVAIHARQDDGHGGRAQQPAAPATGGRSGDDRRRGDVDGRLGDGGGWHGMRRGHRPGLDRLGQRQRAASAAGGRRAGLAPQVVVQPDDVVERPGLARPQLRRALAKFGDGLAELARQRAHLALQILFEGRQARLRTLESLQRLVDRREAGVGDAGGLRLNLAERLLVGLPDAIPLVLQAAFELVDAGGGLVQQAPLDVVPLAEPTVELDDGGGMALVVLRPAIEDAGALARHVREPRLEAVERVLRLTQLPQGEVDLLDLNLKIGRARRLFHRRR